MNYSKITDYNEKILSSVDADLSDKYEEGILNNFTAYVQRVSRDVIKVVDETLYVPEDLITDEYIKQYFKKSNYDLSIKDCAHMAVSRVGIPPEDEMSIESLEKTIKKVVKEYKSKIYIKRFHGKNTRCIDWSTAQEILSHQEITDIINFQTQKAERKNTHNNNVERRAYEFEKDKIALLESLNSNNDDCNCSNVTILSTNEKTNLMIQAIYRKLFTEFDFDKYESYLDEMNLLYDAWDFGERYQELYDIFHSPDYKGEFYKINIEDDFLDSLADKIAKKIIKKMGNDESSK